MVKYESAYRLVPGKHGFAVKIGIAAYEIGDCAKAEQYLRHFMRYEEPAKKEKHQDRVYEILNKIEYSGCAAAPEEPQETESSKKGCSVHTDGATPNFASLALLGLLALRRRNEHRSGTFRPGPFDR